MAPAISIITPSYRMAPFLEQAIRSVLGQDVDSFEYAVLDGGSTDGTLEILKKFGDRMKWRSQPDGGAAAALREGFQAATGEILGWLNADDVLCPGALKTVLSAFRDNPDAVAVYGGGVWTDEAGTEIDAYPTAEFSLELLARECFICQPACFFRASAYREVGGIDPDLRSAFDYDLWIRLARLGRFVHVPERLAQSRMHRSNKTLGQRGEVFREGMAVLEKHFGYVPASWIYSEQVWLRDGRDQFFEPHRPSLAAFLASLPEGLRRNPRHRARYVTDWLSAPDWRGRLSGLSLQSPSM